MTHANRNGWTHEAMIKKIRTGECVVCSEMSRALCFARRARVSEPSLLKKSSENEIRRRTGSNR